MVAMVLLSILGCLPDDTLVEEHLERSCSRELHELGRGIVLESCAGQLMDVEQAELMLTAADANEALVGGLDITPGSQALVVDQVPSSCEWVALDVVTKAALLACPQGRYVAAGGCAATQTLNASAPWQTPSSIPPLAGQKFGALTPLNGWMCEQAGPGFDRLVTSALCCELEFVAKGGPL